MTTAIEDLSNKRPRRAALGSAIQMTDLPDALLVHVAKFLPMPAVALFAVALTAPSESWRCVTSNGSDCQHQPSVASKAVISSLSSTQNQNGSRQRREGSLDVLDFAEIDKYLAWKLSDDDVCAVLVCIDAVHKLKILKLTGLYNITGRGLEPLRGSVVLEQLDLSIVKQCERPNINPEPLISEAMVVPILDSVVDAPGSSLRQLQFCYKWKLAMDCCWRKADAERVQTWPRGSIEYRFRPGPGAALNTFIPRYEQLLSNRPFDCAGCSNPENCWGTGPGPEWLLPRLGTGGPIRTQWPTCYSCLRNFCIDYEGTLNCEICEKVYCDNCSPVADCGLCNTQACKGCRPSKECEGCNETFCHDHLDICNCCNLARCHNCTHPAIYQCQGTNCETIGCSFCAESSDVQMCGKCSQPYCSDCCLEKYRSHLVNDKSLTFCTGCVGMAMPHLLKENGLFPK